MHREQNDKESVSSKGEQLESTWVSFKRFFCPCLLPIRPSGKSPRRVFGDSSTDSKVDRQNTIKEEHLDLRGVPQLRKKTSKQRKISGQESRRQGLLQVDSSSIPEHSYRQTMQIQLSYNNRMRSMQELNWPVCQYTENYLISIGNSCSQILAKVTPVVISTDPDKFKKQIVKSGIKKDKQAKGNNNEFDLFWNERYLFFQRFDQGIKIKEEMLSKIPYESLSEYIASKCNGAKFILDGFAGVGSLTIKMASINSCAKVIANEKDKEKLSFLLNNATVYEVDCFLELSNRDFLKIDRKDIDVVVVHPPLQEHHNTIKIMDEIISKSMTLAPNFIMLLPPDINIEALSSSIFKYAKKYNWMQDFCSIKIQKIYNKQQLRYILICAGKLVQSQVKLNDELDYIYGRLKRFGDKFFKHKKIIKKIREDHGMLELLSVVRQSQKIRKDAFISNPVVNNQLFVIDCFYDLILKLKMITPEKLQKIKLEQEQSLQKAESLLYSGALLDQPSARPASPIMEEEKIEENPTTTRDAELTTSEYSYLSYLESMGKKSREASSIKSSLGSRVASGQSGVIIKRANPNSMIGVESVSEKSSDVQNASNEPPTRNNIVSVNSKSRNSELSDLKKEEHEVNRKNTTFNY